MAKTSSDHRLTSTERKAAGALAAVFGLRMLGLFLIMPVLAVYGQAYPDYSAMLVGVAIGAYGLTQALLQIPMGMLSDRIGRRPVIIVGLLIFIAGSIIAALADTLTGVIIGRALQGGGAIAAAILALAADISRDQQRAKVMAMIGMCIGLAFALALVLGPFLANHLGMAGLFWFTALAAASGLLLFMVSVPKVEVRAARGDVVPVKGELSGLLKHGQLLRLNLGVFVLHAMLTAFFVVVPTRLVNAGLAIDAHAWLYLPVLLLSFVIMVPMLIRTEKKRAQAFYFRINISLLLIAVLAVFSSGLFSLSWTWLVVAILLFFVGFNYLEANLPASLTRFAPAGSKGSASGIYATWQFAGAFVGGVAGGSLLQQFGTMGVGIFCAALLVLWLLLTIGMQAPPEWQNISRKVNDVEINEALLQQLREVTGVAEVRYVASEQIIYLKVHKSDYNETEVAALLNA